MKKINLHNNTHMCCYICQNLHVSFPFALLALMCSSNQKSQHVFAVSIAPPPLCTAYSVGLHVSRFHLGKEVSGGELELIL